MPPSLSVAREEDENTILTRPRLFLAVQAASNDNSNVYGTHMACINFEPLVSLSVVDVEEDAVGFKVIKQTCINTTNQNDTITVQASREICSSLCNNDPLITTLTK